MGPFELNLKGLTCFFPAVNVLDEIKFDLGLPLLNKIIVKIVALVKCIINNMVQLFSDSTRYRLEMI